MKLFKKSKIGFLACALLVFSMAIGPLQVNASQQPVGNADSGNTSELDAVTNMDYVCVGRQIEGDANGKL